MFVFEDGQVHACGQNEQGQLGNPDTGRYCIEPVKICVGDHCSVQFAACGGGHRLDSQAHSVVLAMNRLDTSDGLAAWACGANSRGQLGVGCKGNASRSFIPMVLEPSMGKAVAVACGEYT